MVSKACEAELVWNARATLPAMPLRLVCGLRDKEDGQSALSCHIPNDEAREYVSVVNLIEAVVLFSICHREAQYVAQDS